MMTNNADIYFDASLLCQLVTLGPHVVCAMHLTSFVALDIIVQVH